MGRKEALGYTLLAIPSAFGIWSAINTSLFSSIKLGVREGDCEDIRHIKFGLDVGLGLVLAFSGGLVLAFKKDGIIPAIGAAATGIGLYALYYHKIIVAFKNKNKNTITFSSCGCGCNG